MVNQYKLYATKDEDTVILTLNREVQYYDEGIRSTEFLSYFDVETLDELARCPIEDLLEGYDALYADYKYHSPEDFEHFKKTLPTLQAKGRVIAEYII